jgi:glycosyltransferase EpsH
MNPKISVIIPVYNAEKYLSAALDSVLLGSFSDFEIIAVNDGSCDGSLAILNAYRERDARVRVIDKHNTGVSDTRNVAIAAAEGEYLAFLDSDDVYATEYLERMYDAVSESGADIAVCDYVTFRGDAPAFECGGKTSPKSATVGDILDSGRMTALWLKLFKKELVEKNSIAFDTALAFGEDLFFSWMTCLCSSKIVSITDKLYGYRMSPEGATARYHDNLYGKYKGAFEKLKQFAAAHGADVDCIRGIDVYFVRRLPTLAFMCARSKDGFFKKMKYISRILEDEVIANISKNYFDELIRGESGSTVSLYQAAANKKALRVFLYGAKLEFRLKLSKLKGRIEEKRRDKK